MESLREAAPEVTVVASADAVYRLDYDELIRDHLSSIAELTTVTTRPDEPESDLVCAETLAGGEIPPDDEEDPRVANSK